MRPMLLDYGVTRKHLVIVQNCSNLQRSLRLFFREGLGTGSAALVKVGGEEDTAVAIVVISSGQISLSVHCGGYGGRYLKRSLLRVIIHFIILK